MLEFALFFDTDSLASISEYHGSNQNVPVEVSVQKAFVEIANRKANKQFLHKIEERKFERESKLTSNDLDSILSVSKLLKEETPFLRHTYSVVYKDGKSDLEKLNESPQRR